MSRWGSIWRGVGRPVGAVVIGLAIAMAACSVIGHLITVISPNGNPETERTQATALLISSFVTLAAGLGIRWYGRTADVASMSRREAIFAVVVIWVGSGIFGGFPFILGASMSPIDGFFEAVSGFSTTGATVITQIESSLARPLLLWRSVIQWLGGMGIVVLFVAIFPNVGVGAKLMYRGEAPGAIGGGLQPRIADTSSILWRLYVLFTIIEILLLWLLGMTPFEALCHSLTNMSTGGFSTRDASIAAFNSPAIEMVITFFMLLAAVNFGIFYAVIRGKSLRMFLRSIELKVYVAVVLVSTVLLTVSILPVHGNNLLQSLRYAVFAVGTFISSTGYGVEDYMQYPPYAVIIIILIMFVGGCSGSTAGGIKIERVVLLAKVGWARISSTFRPNVVQVVRMDRNPVPATILTDVATFFAVYMVCLAACVLAVAYIDRVPAPTAFGATLSCLSNMGPAPFYVDSDNFASYSGLSKLLFAVAMILGRLEFFTVFALFIPDFWKR